MPWSEPIEATPSEPYVGELWDMPDPSLSDVRLLAWPSPNGDGGRPYPGWTVPASSEGQLFTPAFLPAEEHEIVDCLWMCLTGLPSAALGIGALSAGPCWQPVWKSSTNAWPNAEGSDRSCARSAKN